MWIAVLLVLLITGAIFYGLANYNKNLLKYKEDDDVRIRNEKEERGKQIMAYLWSPYVILWQNRNRHGSVAVVVGSIFNLISSH